MISRFWQEFSCLPNVKLVNGALTYRLSGELESSSLTAIRITNLLCSCIKTTDQLSFFLGPVPFYWALPLLSLQECNICNDDRNRFQEKAELARMKG